LFERPDVLVGQVEHKSMEKIKLNSQSRTEIGRKVSKGRKLGKVPAVVYGRGIKSHPLWINGMEIYKLIQKSGESVVIDLDIDKKEKRNVIIHEVQRDPVKGQYIHVDFFQINMKQKIETEVDLVFFGEAPAVKELDGILVKNVFKVEVKCLPDDLPSHIDVDISSLKTFEDHIYAKNLAVSEKVELEIEPETVIALVAPPHSEQEMEQLDEKVEEDITKVEGVVKPEQPGEEASGEEGKKETSGRDKKGEKKEGKKDKKDKK